MDLVVCRDRNDLPVAERHHFLNDRHVKRDRGKREEVARIIHIRVRERVFVVIVEKITQIFMQNFNPLRRARRTGCINAVRRIAFRSSAVCSYKPYS